MLICDLFTDKQSYLADCTEGNAAEELSGGG